VPGYILLLAKVHNQGRDLVVFAVQVNRWQAPSHFVQTIRLFCIFRNVISPNRVFIPNVFTKDQTLEKDKQGIILDYVISAWIFEAKLVHPVDVVSLPRPACFNLFICSIVGQL
jgi:hypothetical protein